MRQVVTTAALLSLALSPLSAGSAYAEERAESTKLARMFSAPDCPITPDGVLKGEQGATKEILPLLIATLIAGVAGQLATGGINAAGDALEQASKEKGIVSEGTTSFYMSRLVLADKKSKVARIEPQAICLVLFSEGSGDLDDLVNERALINLKDVAIASGTPPLKLFGKDSEREDVLGVLRKHGLGHIPSIYTEVRILSTDEGLYLRPVLIWYRDKLAGAPPGSANAEYHLNLATPGSGTGAGDIGTTFAGARMILPKIRPGQILSWVELKSATSVMVPLRPSAGFVDTKLAATNTIYAQFATRNKELAVANSAFLAAQTKDKAKSTPETRDALRTTGEALKEATAEQKAAAEQVTALTGSDVGATNAKGRFVVVKDANQFGLALAKALKGQADAAGKAVTSALTPEPTWAASDTAYVTAKSDLDGAQRDYDAALTSGDSGNIAKAGDALLLKKAKLNEAAAGLNRALPYPNLINQ